MKCEQCGAMVDDPRIAELEADLTQAVQMYTDAAGERDKALADLAAAQAERDDANEECGYRIKERDEAVADLAAANTRADAMFRVAEKHEAEAAALRVDAERGKWMIDHAEWWRDGDETRMVIRVADKADLSCYAMRELAIDQARGAHD